MGKKAIVEPALKEAYGENLKEYFNEHFSDMTINEVHEVVKKDTNGIVTSASLYGFAKNKLDFSFKSTGKQGRKSTVLPKLIEHYGSEDKLKERLVELSSENVSKATYIIKEETNIEFSNIAGIAKKLGVEFKAGRKGKPSSNLSPVTETPKHKGEMVAVQISCQHCDHQATRGVFLDDGSPIVKGNRCPSCKTWDSFIATYVVDGEEHRKAVVKVSLGKNIAVNKESLVDKNLAPIVEVEVPNHHEESEKENASIQV